jgi:hypothetical protein
MKEDASATGASLRTLFPAKPFSNAETIGGRKSSDVRRILRRSIPVLPVLPCFPSADFFNATTNGITNSINNATTYNTNNTTINATTITNAITTNAITSFSHRLPFFSFLSLLLLLASSPFSRSFFLSFFLALSFLPLFNFQGFFGEER